MSYKRLLRSIGLLAGLAVSGAVFAIPIKVLWYTGGTEASGPGTYEANINTLAAANGWTVTFWTGGSMPSGSYNVLVIASPEGGWSSYPNYSALTSSLGSITFGNREMLTGQDADWHYQNYPGPANFDGPKGFLSDSINWAGNGTGMGLVALGMDGLGICYGGPALGLPGYSADCQETNNVQIPASVAGYPINTGLTSAGLSNWNTASHISFWNLDPSDWVGINVNGDDDCGGAPATCYVTIISAGTASGGIGVPEPADLGVFGLGLLLVGAFVGLRRRVA